MQVREPSLVAQDTPPTSDDVVVTALRDLENPQSPVTRGTLGSVKTGAGPVASRSVFNFSQRFARCAMKRTGGNLELLRRVLDGRTNSAAQRRAQQMLVLAHASCAQNPTAVLSSSGIANAALSRSYDTSYYDRGALFIEAINAFAPGFRPTKLQTENTDVQLRFNVRELPLAKFRLPADRRYFEMAVCLVRLQPELATRLVSHDLKRSAISRIEAAMVNRARVCTGNARRVYFDPSQFRFYIADALYRWMVAAQGVTSLIPAR